MMFIIKNEELNLVSGGIESLSNGIYTVTYDSSFTMGNLKMLANQVIDTTSETVLYSGSQCTFCYQGTLFVVAPVTGGYSYIPWNDCQA